MKYLKTIGIIGGMGPVATADFYQSILKKFQERLGAVQDNDFPHIIIDSVSLEGSSEKGVEDGHTILLQLQDSIRRLCNAGVDFIVVTCNTEHVFYKEMQAISTVPTLNLLDCVLKTAKNKNLHKVYLLAAENTYQIYQSQNTYKDLMLIIPDEKTKSLVTNVILSVMAGKANHNKKNALIQKVNKLASNGSIDSLLLGCTELPHAISPLDVNTVVLDSLEILAEETFLQSVKNLGS